MNYYNEQLKQLQMQVASKKRLESVLGDLREQQKELTVKVAELEKKKQKEQKDVERLECGSLAAFFYNVVGKMDDKLTKEKQEAYEAAVKYDVAHSELQSVEGAIQFHEKELAIVRGSEEQYETVLRAKMDAVKQAGIPEAVEMLKLEEQIAFLETQEKEINEAIAVGENASTIVEGILKNLSDAEAWGTWDLVGGGLIADMAKHEHLEIAQKQVEELQVALRHFKTELADVAIWEDLQISIDGFLKFADYFFDGLFADWAVMDRISESQKEVQNTQKQIAEVLSRLASMLSVTREEWSSTREKLREITLRAAL